MMPFSAHKLCTTLLAVLTLAAAVIVCFDYRRGIHIDTDLKSLSPALQQPQVVSDSLDDAAAHAAQRLTLVLMSRSEDELEYASDALTDELQNHPSLRYVDRSELVDHYTAAITRYPFNFLTEQAQQMLQHFSDEQLLEAGKRQLYSRTAPRIIAVNQDPFGYLNQYALEVLDRFADDATGGAQEAVISGEVYFYTTHTLLLPDDSLELASQNNAITEIDSAVLQLTQTYPGLKVLRSGMVFFAADAAVKAKADISLISTVSSVAVFLLLLAVFRRTGAVLLPAVSIIGGFVFAFAISHFLFRSLHVFTLVFGASLIGVVVDYSLHYFYLYRRGDAATERHLHKALLLSLLTSVIGYTALSLSGLKALQQIALFSASGLVYAWLSVATFARYVKPPRIHDRYLQIAIRHTLNLLSRCSTRALVAGGTIAAALAVASTGLHWPSDDSPRAFFAPNPQLIAEETQASELSAAYEPARFVVIRGSTTDALYLNIDALQAALEEHSLNLLGIDALLPSPVQQVANRALNRRLYSDEGIIETFLTENGLQSLQHQNYPLRYQNSAQQVLLPLELLAQLQEAVPPLWAADAEQVYSFLLLPKGADTAAVESVVSQFPQAKLISAVAEASHALGQLRRNALMLLGAAIAIIALFMSVQFGVRRGLRLVLIPACAIAITLVAFAALGTPLTLFHVMALFLVLGLGMDYVIFTAEIPEHYQQTLAAIILSAATSLLAFGLLSLSSLPAVSAFGLTVLIGNLINLIGCIVITSRRLNHNNE